jgi:hypothetical protein
MSENAWPDGAHLAARGRRRSDQMSGGMPPMARAPGVCRRRRRPMPGRPPDLPLRHIAADRAGQRSSHPDGSAVDRPADRRPAFRIERAALYWGSSSNNRKEVIQCLIVNRRVRQTGSSPRWERTSPNGTRLQRFSRTLARQWRGRLTGRPLSVLVRTEGLGAHPSKAGGARGDPNSALPGPLQGASLEMPHRQARNDTNRNGR